MIQKLKAGATAEAKGEQNPGLVNNNNNSRITSSNNNNNNNNTEGKGKKTGLKALQKKNHQLSKSAGNSKQLATRKLAENEVGQSQSQTVDWSAWDAC